MIHFIFYCLVLMNGLNESVKQPVVHMVKMEGMKFVPNSLEIKSGETVRWINESGTSHNVVANDGSFKSEMLHDKGNWFEYTFRKAGEVKYYCQPHRLMGMKGVVHVK